MDRESECERWSRAAVQPSPGPEAAVGGSGREAGRAVQAPRLTCGSCGKTNTNASALCAAWVRLHGGLRGLGTGAVPRAAAAAGGFTPALERFEGFQIVGIDGTSTRRGQRYITVVHDLKVKRRRGATFMPKPGSATTPNRPSAMRADTAPPAAGAWGVQPALHWAHALP